MVLHSQNTIYGNLRSGEVFWDETFKPRLAEFRVHEQPEYMSQRSSYSSPSEILKGKSSNSASGVYARRMLAYLVAPRLDTVPGSNKTKFAHRIVSDQRPPFTSGLGSRWQNRIKHCRQERTMSPLSFQKSWIGSTAMSLSTMKSMLAVSIIVSPGSFRHPSGRSRIKSGE
jgi:hypothetical protein